MDGNAKEPRLERDKTDESLLQERNKTDQALEATRGRIDEVADDVIERAREQADEVLDTAREQADDKREAAGVAAPTQDVLAQERIEEDEALQSERDAADEVLRRERLAQSRDLAALLPLEREKTDRFLLTERARSDDALAHRDDFMGIASHDLRDLLAGIAAHATLVTLQATDTEEGRRTVASMDRIRRYVARMNRLIGDLVDVVSIDAGKLAVHPEPADAAELISEAVDLFAHAAGEKGVSLARTAGEQGLPAVLDKERMLQVLANLVANAIRFTASGGAITIEAERTGDDLRVSVLDTGEGVAEDVREAIFERFWQVGAKARGGLGLGLYISRCIVDAHGGRIWVESNPGGGSAFRFTIPAAGHASP
jgi:signal transduction histidine kinase